MAEANVALLMHTVSTPGDVDRLLAAKPPLASGSSHLIWFKQITGDPSNAPARLFTTMFVGADPSEACSACRVFDFSGGCGRIAAPDR